MGNTTAILYALLAAVFYAVNVPFSKKLLTHIEPTFMAGFLYLGAGLGVGILYLFNRKKEAASERLTGSDLPYVIGMILLDIAAPILLMFGIRAGTSSSASLLGNFEIVATTLMALLIFKETVTGRLWGAIILITLASAMLSFEGTDSLHFSVGSLLVLGATACWGLENNCTRRISDKSTYEIVILKGIFSGGGSLLIALFSAEHFPEIRWIFPAMLLGFVAYGLSIFFYVRAQSRLGAARTSAYYAAAPFVGAALSFLLLGERLSGLYFAAAALMLAGTVLVVLDTFAKHHAHEHQHVLTHTHNGTTHTHVITHSHAHEHIMVDEKHGHHHSRSELEKELHTGV